MNLKETQFRLIKSRAKARFGEFGRKRVNATFTISAPPVLRVA
jgi:hypothetical protein